MSAHLRIGIVSDALEERQAAGGARELAVGGVGVYIHNLVLELRRLEPRHEYVLIRCGQGRLALYGDGDRSVFLPDSILHRYARWIDVPYGALVERLGLDLLHFPNQFGGAFLPKGVKRVVTLHDITPILFPRFHPWRSVLGFRTLLRAALRAADRVIVDSRATAHDLVERGLAASAKITTIPLGVDRRFQPAVRRAGFTDRYLLPERYLLNVGVLEPRKNHRLLAQVLRRLHSVGERVGLVVVGRDGWAWSDPFGEPEYADLRSWVRIFRNVPDDDLPEFYGRADAFLYASFYEGFGLPLLEAMACGTPIVTSNASSLPEVVGDAALLADPADPIGFFESTRRLLADRALAARLADAGRQRAAGFSWRTTAEKTMEVYERVVAGEA
jgi:glycosyltransferase involved in cell wall biosynthesis